jgi:hypothetical protein
VHIDFSAANPRSVGSSWKLLQRIDPYNGFAIYLSVTAEVSGGSDVCGNESTGAHLHMDAPESESDSRNLSLVSNQSVSTTTNVFAT